MIETYAFLAMFAVQIVTLSVLYPTWFIRHVRVRATRVSTERLALLYPGVDLRLAQERFLARYRALNAGIAVLGLLLLGWLFSYVRQLSWDDGTVKNLTTVYFLMQFLPVGLVAWLGAKGNKELKRSLLEAKRKAVLVRRGLFDFVSPSIVAAAILSYFLFAAFAMYVEQNPFPGFKGASYKIGGVSVMYGFVTLAVYFILYRTKSNPLETHADRMHAIGMGVKIPIYTCVAAVLFVSLDLTIGLLDLQSWEPFAQSAFFVACALLTSIGLAAPPRAPEVDEFGSSPVR